MDSSKSPEAIAVDEMMKFLYDTALPFSVGAPGFVRWEFHSFLSSRNGQKLRKVLESLVDTRPTWEKKDPFAADVD